MNQAISILVDARKRDPFCKSYSIHLWLSRMYAQNKKFVLATSVLDPCVDPKNTVHLELESEYMSQTF